MFFTTKSVRGFKCAHLSLNYFVQNYGVMEHLVVNNDRTMAFTEWRKAVHEYRINHKTTEPYPSWQNRAELDVREIKRSIRRFKKRSGSLKSLWCFLGVLVAALQGFTAYDVPKLQGRCATVQALRYTPNISPWIQHEWYEDVWYHGADGESKIGKWLGLAAGIGRGDCYWILPSSCRPIAGSTVWGLTSEDRVGVAVRRSTEELNAAIDSKIGDGLQDVAADNEIDLLLPVNADLLEDLDNNEVAESDALQTEMDDYTPETFDGYLTASVMLPRGGKVVLKANVIARKRDANGNPVGKANSNPILDTRECIVEFEDGAQETYAVNLIAENMYSQLDGEGNPFLLLSEIIDHATDGRAMRMADGMYTDKKG